MSDTEHDAVTDLPGAPADDEGPITVTAPWHNAPGTDAYAEPEVTTVRAYDKPDPDGPIIAKVMQPPAQPTARRGPKAQTKDEAKAAKTKRPQVQTLTDGSGGEGQADADGAPPAPEGA